MILRALTSERSSAAFLPFPLLFSLDVVSYVS